MKSRFLALGLLCAAACSDRVTVGYEPDLPSIDAAVERASDDALVESSGDDLSPADTADATETGSAMPWVGFLHAQGTTLVDDLGNEVVLRAINWSGMQDESKWAPDGLHLRGVTDLLSTIRALGFNTVRFPISTRFVQETNAPTFVPALSPELLDEEGQPLRSLALLDAMIGLCRAHGLHVVLERHFAQYGETSPVAWSTATCDEMCFRTDWVKLGAHYQNDDTVVGFDLQNAPRAAATWPISGPTSDLLDWPSAAERTGNAILAVHPNALIMVEGVETIGVDGGTAWIYWPGGNLHEARARPIVLDRQQQLVYATQDYSSSEGQQSWFGAQFYPDNLPAIWQQMWGGLGAPVFVASFGGRVDAVVDQQWYATFTSYLRQNGQSFAFWALSPSSDGREGLFSTYWTTLDERKLGYLTPLLPP